MSKQTWVFDLDGTLVDSFPQYFTCLTVIFEKYGKTFDDTLRLESLTDQLMAFLRKHLAEHADAAMEDIRIMSRNEAGQIPPFPGIVPLLDHLKEKGARLAVWTNRDLPSATLILQHSGLSGYFQAFVSGSCVKDRKPHPEGLTRIVEELQCDLEMVTMVGDHEHDVTGAKSATVRAVRASWHRHWEVVTCGSSDHQFYSVEEFATWVESQRDL